MKTIENMNSEDKLYLYKYLFDNKKYESRYSPKYSNYTLKMMEDVKNTYLIINLIGIILFTIIYWLINYKTLLIP